MKHRKNKNKEKYDTKNRVDLPRDDDTCQLWDEEDLVPSNIEDLEENQGCISNRALRNAILTFSLITSLCAAAMVVSDIIRLIDLPKWVGHPLAALLLTTSLYIMFMLPVTSSEKRN